jgi:hypothetical protein
MTFPVQIKQFQVVLQTVSSNIQVSHLRTSVEDTASKKVAETV